MKSLHTRIRGWPLLLTVICSIAAIALASACGGGDSGDSVELAPDQTLRIAISGEPESIDPGVAAFAESTAIAKNIFATLLRFDPTTSQVNPYVAVQVPTKDNGGISGDGLVYTFHLREDAVWEDGAPLAAGDFEYALKRIMDPRLGSYYGASFYSGSILGGTDVAAAVDADEDVLRDLISAIAVNALDDHTLEVTLSQPSTSFNLLMSLWPSAALRQDVIEQHGDIGNSAWTEAGSLVASGPFRLAEWDHGTRIVLENNPNFWNEDMMPTLTRIELVIIEDENTAYAAYLGGDLDMAPAPISSLRSLTESNGADGNLRRVPEVSNFALVFNMSQPPFDDVEARRAFCRSIDRGTAVAEIRQGSGTPTTGWLPPSLVPYYDETRGNDLVFDPEAARSSLSTALSVASANAGSASFPDVSITYADTGSNGTLMEYLQGQWKTNLEVDVGLEGLDPPTFGQTFFSGQFDLGYIGFGQDYHHPENWLLLWTETGALNAGGYANPAFTATIEAAMDEDDFDAAVALWQRSEEILIDEDVALCALFNSEATWLIDSNVSGLVMTGADSIPGDAFFWKIAVTKSS